MGNLRFSLPALQTGCLCLELFQPASSEGECDSAESCLDYDEEQSSRVWYVWLGVLLFLVTVLLCAVLCCLQCCLKRWRLSSSSPRTLAVFALGDVSSACESDATPWTPPPKAQPHLQIPEGTSGRSSFSLGADGSPPSYEEAMKEVDSGGAPLRDLQPPERCGPSRLTSVEEERPSGREPASGARRATHGGDTLMIQPWSSLSRLE